MYWKTNGWTKDNGFVREGVLLNINADIICVGETHHREKEELKLDSYIFKGDTRKSLHIYAPKGSRGVDFFIKELLLQKYSYTGLDKSRWHNGYQIYTQRMSVYLYYYKWVSPSR